MKLKTEVLELRGIANVTSKKGNVYYNIFAEDATGRPEQFFTRDSSVFPQGLKKGDSISLDVVYNKFKELEVVAVHRFVEA